MKWLLFGGLVFALAIGGLLGWFGHLYSTQTTSSIQDFVEEIIPEPARPLQAYSFEELRKGTPRTAEITIEPDSVASFEAHLTYTYTSKTLGKTMSGAVNVPLEPKANNPIIVLLRGWVPGEGYVTGSGSKNVAAALAQAGFITIAPDFFGYGNSDPEPEDEWVGRFQKPLVVTEIISALRTRGLALPDGFIINPKNVGMWGHSNGGQIALSTLTIAREPIPTALWAPVTAPFPYSILYFSDEEADEGLITRKWISQFDRLYDAREFSFTNYLDGLCGPLQIHQGTNDDAVLVWWNDEFTAKLDKENELREASASASTDENEDKCLQPIEYDYYVYPGANHNITPGWDLAVKRDISFFTKELELTQ